MSHNCSFLSGRGIILDPFSVLSILMVIIYVNLLSTHLCSFPFPPTFLSFPIQFFFVSPERKERKEKKRKEKKEKKRKEKKRKETKRKEKKRKKEKGKRKIKEKNNNFPQTQLFHSPFPFKPFPSLLQLSFSLVLSLDLFFFLW